MRMHGFEHRLLDGEQQLAANRVVAQSAILFVTYHKTNDVISDWLGRLDVDAYSSERAGSRHDYCCHRTVMGKRTD
ncbi:MAG: hypothetical protein V3T53_11415 [Phycisphaerales bacterium]